MRKSPWRSAVLAVGAGLVLATLAPAAHSEVIAGRVLGNSRLDTGNDPLRGLDIPAMVVDPANPRHIVMIVEDYLNGQCDFHTSFDGGKTWPNSGHLTSPSDFFDPPCRTFDSGGYAHFNKSVVFGTGQNVYTTYANHRGPQQRPESNVVAGEGDSVIVNRSTDGGKSFERGVVAIEGAKDSRPFIIRPGVAVQPRAQGDKLYVVGWYVVNPPGMGAAGGAGDRRAVVATSEDGGKTWSKTIEIQGPDEKVREITPPVVDNKGNVFIAWRNRDDPATAPHPIVVAKSSDGGVTWTRTPLGNADPAPTNVPAPAGGAGFPRMAVDPNTGALYVVYTGFQFGDLDVVLQRSTDAGVTWSPPLRVNDDPKNNGWRQLGPQVFVAPNGRVDVVWFDARTTYPNPVIPRPAGNGDIYYASSSDGGATVSANRRITNRSINLDEGLTPRTGSYTWWGPAAAPLGNDAILFAWTDPRLGNVDNATSDIMLATLQLGAAAGAPALTRLPKASAANLSIVASQLSYPGGAERIGANFTSKLVVVNKDDKAGAMAGAVLARANSSPLLVTDGSTLSKEAKKEIGRLRPTGMFVIGDEKAVPQSLVDAIIKAGVNTVAPTTTTPAPTTTAAAPTTAVGAPTTAATTTTVPTSTANRTAVTRLTGATPADLGKAIAGALDVRNDEQKGRSLPAFNAAVAVNPDSDTAAAGIAFAAANRYPIVFVSVDGVPAATADTFNAMAIQNTWVVGGTAAVGDTAMGKLPNAKRLGGTDLAATSTAVINELKARGAPVNVVYVADSAKPVDAAMAGAAVARLGGLLVVAPGADSAAADKVINGAGLSATVDEMVVLKSAGSTGTSVPWAIFVISGLLAVTGLILIAQASKRKAKTAAPPAKLAKQAAAPTASVEAETKP